MDEVDIWRWCDGEYVAHCPTREIYKKMMRWKHTRHRSVYYLPDGPNEYDVRIPEEYVERARRILTRYYQSLPQKADTKRVLKDNKLRGTKSSVSPVSDDRRA